MIETPPNPRLFGIPATDADVVAVIRRGPSRWCQLGRWDVGRLRYEPGSWLKGRLFPQRCDLAPDGRYLCAMAMKGAGIYLAVSRLPWLKPLAWWDLGDTWGRGAHFVAGLPGLPVEAPDAGSIEPLRYGLEWTRTAQFAVERRRGWVEAPDSEPRAAEDIWDQYRQARMVKQRPGEGAALTLRVEGRYAAFREFGPRDFPGGIRYQLVAGDTTTELADVQWADWSRDGRLLVATRDGRLQVRQPGDGDAFDILFEEDLSILEPDPQPPPPEALQF